jgi:hypothetical protein
MRLLALLASAWIASDANAQTTAPQTPQGPDVSLQQQFQQLPPQVRLGLRGAQVQLLVPVIDRVVLVPDATTYLDELNRWSLKGRWPVLIEDEQLAPMFVRKFRPAQIIRRESVGAQLASKEERQKRLQSVLVHAFDGEATASARDVFAAHRFVPPGVVISSVDDPAWTAAIALAAGHGQPLAWFDEPLGEPAAELSDGDARSVAQRLEQLVKDEGYSYAGIGDDIDAVTVCRTMPGVARIKMIGPGRPELPAGADLDGPIALTDFICRHAADASRWAYAGWIWGDETRCAYMAMCSLFLSRDRAWLFNGYPTTDDWQAYGLDQVAETLTAAGFNVTSFRNAESDFASWRRRLPGGLLADVVWVNTKGNSDFFDLSQGQGRPDDVPLLMTPVALHIIHSWSMQNVQSRATVGGRWLANGAYAAVGSCWEPYLGAFVPPPFLAQRCVNFVPYLVAARWWNGEGALWKPWRVMTIGDPLMLVAPLKAAQPRVQQAADYGVDLAVAVKDVMRAAPSDDSGRSFGEAITMLDLLGKDDIAIQLWRAADQSGHGVQAARQALGPLFRARNVEEFMKAWDQLPGRDDAAKDMLWHLHMPRLLPQAPALDDDTLLQLQSAIRQPMPWVDIDRLAPQLARAFGAAHVRDVIEREFAKLTTAGQRQEMAKLLEKF